MPTPTSDQNEPSKMKKLMSGNVDESIRSKLPPGNDSTVQRPSFSTYTVPPAASPEPAPNRWRHKFLPAFWTIASVLSMTVNIILIVILLIMFQMLGAIQDTTNDQFSGLLGGLYNNFVRMDQATISRTIPVDANIPLDIMVPVQMTTRIQLTEPVVIDGTHVYMDTGEVIINAPQTRVTLPGNLWLPVRLDFQLKVQNTIPVHLEVPVNIPLRETQLHEPFVGLQKVVEPWYCIVEPAAMVNGSQVCSATTSPTTDPAVISPTPFGTVIP